MYMSSNWFFTKDFILEGPYLLIDSLWNKKLTNFCCQQISDIDKFNMTETNYPDFLSLTKEHSLFVSFLHLSLCRHWPLLKYSKCLILSLFVVILSFPFFADVDFAIISILLLMVKQLLLVEHSIKALSINCLNSLVMTVFSKFWKRLKS